VSITGVVWDRGDLDEFNNTKRENLCDILCTVIPLLASGKGTLGVTLMKTSGELYVRMLLPHYPVIKSTE